MLEVPGVGVGQYRKVGGLTGAAGLVVDGGLVLGGVDPQDDEGGRAGLGGARELVDEDATLDEIDVDDVKGLLGIRVVVPVRPAVGPELLEEVEGKGDVLGVFLARLAVGRGVARLDVPERGQGRHNYNAAFVPVP